MYSSFATPWTLAYQASLSMGFSRQDYWSGLPFPSPRDLPQLGMEPMSPVSPALQEDSLEKEMATHSSNLAWRIPRTEEPGGLQSMGLHRVRQN